MAPATVSRRAALAALTATAAIPLLGGPTAAAAQSRTPALPSDLGTDIDLSRYRHVAELSDSFSTQARLEQSWSYGLWYPRSGVGIFDPARACVHDSVLSLEARQGADGGYTFGAVESRFDTPGLRSYVEVRARVLTSAANVLSAIWLQSSNLDGGPNLLDGAAPNPEIDVLETFHYDGVDSATHIWPDNTDATHVAFGGNDGYLGEGVDISRGYHLYGVERRDGHVRIFFDRRLVWDLEAPDPSLWRMSRHVVLSLEGHLGRPVPEALPATYDIDSVTTYYYEPGPSLGRRPVTLRAGGGAVVRDAAGLGLDPGAEGEVLRLTRQGDFTYVVECSDGSVVGLDGGSAAPGTAAVPMRGAATGRDAAGSRQRWHVLQVDGGVQLVSKLAGLPLVARDGRLLLGAADEAATVWRLDGARGRR